MNNSVWLWISQRSLCEARKRPAKKPKAPLTQYSVGFPMDRLSVDVLGPFPVTKTGSWFILVVQENFTKFVAAYVNCRNGYGIFQSIWFGSRFA